MSTTRGRDVADRDALEQRRRDAMVLYAAGVSQATVARHYGVSRVAVSRWAALYDGGGVAALRRADHMGRPKTEGRAERRSATTGRPKGHGQTGSPLYGLWAGIKARCFNAKRPDYRWYGGRGISMWSGWAQSFVCFRDDVLATIGPKPGPSYSIDRIDNEAGYVPGNLRWATPTEQTRNSRGHKDRAPNLCAVCGVAIRRSNVLCPNRACNLEYGRRYRAVHMNREHRAVVESGSSLIRLAVKRGNQDVAYRNTRALVGRCRELGLWSNWELVPQSDL